jgi:hypothetical protein
MSKPKLSSRAALRAETIHARHGRLRALARAAVETWEAMVKDDPELVLPVVPRIHHHDMRQLKRALR